MKKIEILPHTVILNSIQTVRNFIIQTLYQILLGWSNQGGSVGGAYNTHGRDEKF
jgi:hypothetical protein